MEVNPHSAGQAAGPVAGARSYNLISEQLEFDWNTIGTFIDQIYSMKKSIMLCTFLPSAIDW